MPSRSIRGRIAGAPVAFLQDESGLAHLAFPQDELGQQALRQVMPWLEGQKQQAQIRQINEKAQARMLPEHENPVPVTRVSFQAPEQLYDRLFSRLEQSPLQQQPQQQSVTPASVAQEMVQQAASNQAPRELRWLRKSFPMDQNVFRHPEGIDPPEQRYQLFVPEKYVPEAIQYLSPRGEDAFWVDRNPTQKEVLLGSPNNPNIERAIEPMGRHVGIGIPLSQLDSDPVAATIQERYKRLGWQV